MATGWAHDGAVQDQIDATVKDAVERVRSSLLQESTLRPSHRHCVECDSEIPEGRQKAIPGVRFCVVCQEAHDCEAAVFSGYNRRGSKDSQLR